VLFLRRPSRQGGQDWPEMAGIPSQTPDRSRGAKGQGQGQGQGEGGEGG